MRAAALLRRRSFPLTFTNQTNWARPTTLAGATRAVPFTTKAGLDAALSGMVAGDYIYYNGAGNPGVLTISSGSTNGYVFTGHNPSSTVTIDFGTKSTTQIDAWSPGASSGNYVKFSYTGTGQFNSFWMYNCSNLNIYGGDFTANIAGGGNNVALNGPLTNVVWYDSVIHDIPGSGLWPNANSGAVAGTASTIDGLKWRGEVGPNWAMNPGADNAHNDHGSGMQGVIAHGSVGTLKNSTFAAYVHDSLPPNATGGDGVVQPEGGGGSAFELGQSGGSNSNITLYVKGENNLMIPNGTNPKSTGSQFGGQCVEIFGSDTQVGTVIAWVESINCTGGCVHGSSGNWTTTSPPIHVLHGRHTNCNQSTAGGNLSIPYDNRWGINYDADCLLP